MRIKMNFEICMASDDNYSPHLGICLTSILENNKNHFINLHILNNNISKNNLNKLLSLTDKYSNLNINCYDINEFFNNNTIKEDIGKNLKSNEFYKILGISAYARLFIAEILPCNLDKILYLDSDIIVLSDLKELFEMDISNYYCAGCIGSSMASYFYKNSEFNDPFINSGVLLINLDKWRTNKFSSEAISLIKSYPDKNFLHDQNIINIISRNHIKIIDSKFNVSSQNFYVKYKKMLKINSFFGPVDKYATEEEMMHFLKNPTIVHFLSQMWDRPWIVSNNLFNHEVKNPYNEAYFYYKKLSPWCDEPFQISNKKFIIKLYYEFIRFIMVYCPSFVVVALYYIKFKIKP